jgi:hypothetical protein
MTRETGAAHSTRVVDSPTKKLPQPNYGRRVLVATCGNMALKELKVWWHVKKYAACLSTPVGFLFYDVKEFN